jgi:hypothetical protein
VPGLTGAGFGAGALGCAEGGAAAGAPVPGSPVERQPAIAPSSAQAIKILRTLTVGSNPHAGVERAVFQTESVGRQSDAGVTGVAR